MHRSLAQPKIRPDDGLTPGAGRSDPRRPRPSAVRSLADRAAGWRPGSEARRLLGFAARALLFALAELFVVALLAGLPALFFWRILATEPGDAAVFATGDFTDLHYPYRRFVSDELARGQVPFWNPYVSAGHPALGDVQFASLYPIGAALARLAGAGMPFRLLEVQVLVHFALAGVFTYLMGRRLLRTRLGAVVAALVFTYGGYLTSFPVQQMIILQTSVWLPLIILLLDLAIVWRSPALAGPAGLALAMAALAGHPQTLFYVLLGAGAYFLYRSWDRGPHLSQPLIAVVFLGVGLGLAAPALIPAYAHLQLTARGETGYAFTTHGFAFRELFGALVPSGFGGQALYQGILPLVLVGVAFLHRTSGRAKAFWLLLAAVALLLSFGGHTFLQSLMYVGLPPAKFRDHERFSFLIGLAVAVLAGFGADALVGRTLDRDALRRYARRLVAALALLGGLAVLGLYGSATGAAEAKGTLTALADRTFFTGLLLALSIGLLLARLRIARTGGWALLAVLLIGVDLFTTGWQHNTRPGEPEEQYPRTAAVAFFQDSGFGLYRIASEGLLPGDGNAGSAYRLQDVVGNSPLELETYQLFTKEVDEWQRWRLLNVRYLITRRNLDADGRFRLVVREGDVNTYEIKPEHRLPRAWVVRRTVFAGSDAEAVALLDGLDPATEAVIRDEGVWFADDSVASGGAEDEAVEVVEYAPDRIRLTARLDRSGLLVLSEVYHPDWSATVDGQSASIRPVNAVLRGLPLRAGDHEIELTFSPAGYSQGLDIARRVATLAGLLLALELLGRLLWLAWPTRRAGVAGR